MWNAQAAPSLPSGQLAGSPFDLVRRQRAAAEWRFSPRLFAQLSAAASTLAAAGGSAKCCGCWSDADSPHQLDDWACCNGRTRGLKAHLSLRSRWPTGRCGSRSRRPRSTTWWSAGRPADRDRAPLTSYDKAYVRLWLGGTRLHEAGCRFVTRPQDQCAPSNVSVKERQGRQDACDMACDRPRHARGQPGFPAAHPACRSCCAAMRLDVGTRAAVLSILTNDLRSSASDGNRRPLPQALANRTAVPLDQAASQAPHLPRPFRKRHPPPAATPP